jgi:hypothetical protein
MQYRQYTRSDLMKHIKQFVSGRRAVLLMRKTLAALAVYEESKQRGVYGPSGNLRQRILVGVYVKRGAKQRRVVQRHLPSINRGRPRKDENLILVSLLATAYVHVTEQPVTQYYRDQPPSAFEAFATPIMDLARIEDTHGWITKHIHSRDRA